MNTIDWNKPLRIAREYIERFPHASNYYDAAYVGRSGDYVAIACRDKEYTSDVPRIVLVRSNGIINGCTIPFVSNAPTLHTRKVVWYKNGDGLIYCTLIPHSMDASSWAKQAFITVLKIEEVEYEET